MAIGRISTNQYFKLSTDRMSKQQTELVKIQGQLATGQRVLKPSDDPLAMSVALGAKAGVKTIDSYQSNITYVNNQLGQMDVALQSASDIMVSIKEAFLQAGNAALSPADREIIAQDIEGRMEELRGIANRTDANGYYMFSGTFQDQEPFQTPGGAITGTFLETSTAAAGEAVVGREIQVASGRFVNLSITGQDAFVDPNTNEDAFAWAQLADAMGVHQRDAQLADGLPAEVFALPQASIDEAVAANTIILLSPDLKEELPVLYLRVRDVAQKRKSKVVEITSRPTGLTPSAWKSVLVEPGKIASTISAGLDPVIVKQIGSGSVSVIVGRMNLAESAESTVLALAEILHVAPQAKVLPVLRRGNVRGAITAGLTPQQGAADTAEILELAAAGKIDTLVLLGADPLSDVPDADLARRGLAGARNIISIDTFMTPSTSQADVVLPAAAFGEKNGTTTNLEGRMSNVAQKITPAGTSRPDWMIAAELATALGKDLGVGSVEEVTAKLANTVPQFAPAMNTKALRHDGVLMNHPTPLTLSRTTLPVQDRNSYDYRIVSFRKLYDAAVGTAKSPSLAQLATGATVIVHPLDLARIGVELGANVQVISTKATAVLPVTTSEDVLRGTAWLPFNQSGNDAREIFDARADIVDVRIEKLA